MSKLDSKIPQGPLAEKWTRHKNEIRLVNPANKRNIDIIVVGTVFDFPGFSVSVFKNHPHYKVDNNTGN